GVLLAAAIPRFGAGRAAAVPAGPGDLGVQAREPDDGGAEGRSRAARRRLAAVAGPLHTAPAEVGARSGDGGPGSQRRRAPMRLAVTILFALLIAAPAAEAQTPKRGGVFHVPTPEAPSLDPHLNAGFVTHLYATPVYGGLVRFPAGPEAKDSADHRILPDVAEKWEYTSPTTVVFTLRKGVRFHRKPPVNGREG